MGGRPFFPLGGQARNSSGYSAAEADAAFEAVKLIHGNTLEIPIYWEQVEPEEGCFDFACVDTLLTSARRHGLKLILLWFATWKNGDMDYSPAWIKTDPERFRRVVAPSRTHLWVLSSHCQANFEADRRAFTALCQHLQEQDGAQQTVIALQIENEPGILGSDRDYGPEAQAVFESPVPAELLDRVKGAGGSVHRLWLEAGAHESGNWPEVFGWAAGEVMTAWSIAHYIDRLAEAGKAVISIPMIVNVWMAEHGWSLPGETYPSGGAVSKLLDIYKWATPHVDLIAPDIYARDSRGYDAACAAYARDDNPLFVPESSPGGPNAWYLFRAVADHAAIGYAFFGAEEALASDGTISPELQALADSFCCLAAALPLVLRFQGTGRLHAVVEEQHAGPQRLDLDGYLGLVEFGAGPSSLARPKDWRHPSQRPLPSQGDDGSHGRGLVIQADRHEFYLVGAGYRLFLRPSRAPEEMRDPALSSTLLLTHLSQFVRIDEGHFDSEGAFVADRRRNGDEANHGVWLTPDVGVVRVIMCE